MDDPSNSSGAPTTVSTSTSTSSVSSAPTEDMDLDSASSLPCYERPSFYCVFVLLPCDYRTDDENECNRHCIGHIRDRHPPDELDCFLCDEFSARSVDKTTAWSLLMDHVVTRHGSRRNVTRTAPPRSIMRLVIQQHSISGTDKRESIYHQNLTKPECRKPHNLMQTSGISQIQEEYT
jgi:hypothetical protein